MNSKINFQTLIYGSLLIFSSLFISCDSDDLEIPNAKTLDFQLFSLEVPQDWTSFTQQGIDTYVGGLTNKIDTLYFDYGYFSFGSIDDIEETAETISFEVLKIDGEDAKIVIEKRAQEPEIRYSLYVDKRDGTNLNRIYSYGFDDEDLIKTIFLSHRFTN